MPDVKCVLIHDNFQNFKSYNGQFRRGADGTPLTYMLHEHIHKSEDQVLEDRFCAETRATMRKSAHQEEPQAILSLLYILLCD